MFTRRANGFAHAGERHRTSYPTNIPSLSAQSPVEQLGSAVQIRMYSANPPNEYHSSSEQADQCLTEYPTHPRYATRQSYPSRHNGQSYGQVGGPDEGRWPLYGEFQAYQDKSHTPLGNKRSFSPLAESYTTENASRHVPALPVPNSEGALAQFGQPVYEGQSADRAVPNIVRGMYDDFSSSLSSPSRNPGLGSLEIPNRQHLTVSTPSSSPPTQGARQSPAIRNGIPLPRALPECCPCPYPHCNRQFTGSSRKGNMSRHIRTKHGAPGSHAREYPCSSRGCGKTFRRSDAKLNHERKEHPGLGRLTAVPRNPLNRAAT